MRVSQADMEKNHKRIVDGAARLVRARGIEAPSVADVMNEAGLTHGGFYRHFETKDALVLAALESAMVQFTSGLEARFKTASPTAAVSGYRADYLSAHHVGNPAAGCPLAALGGDVARGPDSLKAAFGAGVKRSVAALMRGMHGAAPQKRESAMRELAMLVGAVVLARASDAKTAQEVLTACREKRV